MKTTLLKKLLLPLLFMAVCINANAATGSMDIGGTTVSDLTANGSGTGWTWTASTETLSLTSAYTGEAIAINCQYTDEIKLVYDGNISISSADADAIYCNGSFTINGSGGTLSFAYTGEDYMYSAITSMWPLTINSGNIKASCTAVGNYQNNAAAVYAMRGFTITGDANITTNVTSAYSHGFFTNLFNSEISTTGIVTANATGEGYAIYIGNEYNLTISNGMVNLSNTDTPANMIYNRFQNGNFNMTGGTVIYNNGTPPTLTSINPTSGTYNTHVTLSGSNLTETTRVSVNGKESKSFKVDSDSQVTFTTPASEAGSANVFIETSGGATYLTNSFTYTNTSNRVTVTSGGNYIGAVLGFIDTEANTTIAKPADPEPIKAGSTTFVFTGGWYKNRTCTIEWDFDTDVVDRDMNIYAKFEYLPEMTPTDGAADVALNATVSATYYGVTGIDLSGITILPAPGNVSASLAENKITIAHDDFEYGTEYTVTIPANATSVNTVEVSWKFTTVSAPPILSPVPIFEGLANEYTAGSAAVQLKVMGTGSEGLTVFRVNGTEAPEFDPAAAGTYLVEAASADGKLRIWKYVKVN